MSEYVFMSENGKVLDRLKLSSNASASLIAREMLLQYGIKNILIGKVEE